MCNHPPFCDDPTQAAAGVVKAIACVDIVPQVCAEVLEVGFADGAAVRKGEIEYVENMANRRTDTSPVYIRLPNPDGHLRPDGTVTVRLSSARGTERLAVPVTAVLQNVQGPYVWIVGENGAVERRPIGRGRIDGPWQFVEKGLAKGERIVADGGHKVRKGMTIVPAPFRP